MKSWKTTATGVLTILSAAVAAGIALLDGNPETAVNIEATVAAIVAGLGLIAARDNSVTSETAGAK